MTDMDPIKPSDTSPSDTGSDKPTGLYKETTNIQETRMGSPMEDVSIQKSPDCGGGTRPPNHGWIIPPDSVYHVHVPPPFDYHSPTQRRRSSFCVSEFGNENISIDESEEEIRKSGSLSTGREASDFKTFNDNNA